MNRRGFTIVELVVVMTIMAILLVLGFVGFASSQANARDAERSADINAIAKGLEIRYTRGNLSGASASFITQGSYPSVYELQHAEGTTVASITPPSMTTYITDLLPGTAPANFTPPNITGTPATTFTPMCTTACAAENATNINAITPGTYVYEPITSANLVCINTECVRFNLYYRQEGSGGTVVKVSSKRQ